MIACAQLLYTHTHTQSRDVQLEELKMLTFIPAAGRERRVRMDYTAQRAQVLARLRKQVNVSVTITGGSNPVPVHDPSLRLASKYCSLLERAR